MVPVMRCLALLLLAGCVPPVYTPVYGPPEPVYVPGPVYVPIPGPGYWRHYRPERRYRREHRR